VNNSLLEREAKLDDQYVSAKYQAEHEEEPIPGK
jgi:hypothetical protein